MSRSAREDAARFGVFLFTALSCCAAVTGSAGFYLILLSLVPVFLIAGGLDRR